MIEVCIRFTQVIALAAGWWGGPLGGRPGSRGTPRPAAGSGGRGLRAGEGARLTKRSELRQPESSGYPP